MRRSLALHLTLAFAAAGFGTAALIAVVVNLAFGARFTDYVSAQQQARRGELVAALAASYRDVRGRKPSALASLDPLAAVADEEVSVFNARGWLVWSSQAGTGGAMAAMDRALMGIPALGSASRVPIMVSGSRAGTALVRMPAAGPPAIGHAFRSSVERLVLLTGIGGGLAAVLVGIFLARRVAAPVRSLTAGQRSARLEHRAADELGEMAAAFNTMADAVEAENMLRCSFARRRRPRAARTTQRAPEPAQGPPRRPRCAKPHDAAFPARRDATPRPPGSDLETLASADGASSLSNAGRWSWLPWWMRRSRSSPGRCARQGTVGPTPLVRGSRRGRPRPAAPGGHQLVLQRRQVRPARGNHPRRAGG